MAAGERSGLRCLRCRARPRVLGRRAARRARGAVSRVAAARSVVARGGGGTSSPPLATLPSPITSPGLRPGARCLLSRARMHRGGLRYRVPPRTVLVRTRYIGIGLEEERKAAETALEERLVQMQSHESVSSSSFVDFCREQKQLQRGMRL